MYSPLLVVHIAAGLTSLISGFISLFARKGSRIHRRAGDVFVVSMMVMGLAGGWIAFTKRDPANTAAGLFTFYLVGSAWLTVYRRKNVTGRSEIAFMILAVVSAASFGILGWLTVGGYIPKPRGAPTAAFFIFAALLSLCAIGDARMIARGGYAGAQRLVRHLWRMGFALFVATGSFFLGRASDPVLHDHGLRAQLFTKAVRATHLPLVPVFVVLGVTAYWLVRVRFTKSYASRVVDRTAANPGNGAAR